MLALEALSEGLAEELDPSWNIKVDRPSPFSSASYINVLLTRPPTVSCQVIILEPGPFRTKCPADNMRADPVHPAYTNPLLPSMQMRRIFENPNTTFNGDPEKIAEAVYKVASLEHPPLRLPIHPQALGVLREKGKHLLDAADEWESWSEGVLLKD